MTTEFLDDLYETDSQSELEFFVEDLKVLAQLYIERFFFGKLTLGGESISLEMMRNPKYMDFILNLDVCGGIDLIYSAVGAEYNKEETHICGQPPDDVRYVIDLYNQCSRMGVPKCFATGIIIMYLELCKGHCIVK